MTARVLILNVQPVTNCSAQVVPKIILSMGILVAKLLPMMYMAVQFMKVFVLISVFNARLDLILFKSHSLISPISVSMYIAPSITVHIVTGVPTNASYACKILLSTQAEDAAHILPNLAIYKIA